MSKLLHEIFKGKGVYAILGIKGFKVLIFLLSFGFLFVTLNEYSRDLNRIESIVLAFPVVIFSILTLIGFINLFLSNKSLLEKLKEN
jgi:hypothetical protein